MPDEVLVKVEGVSKKFCKTLKRSLLYGAKDVWTELSGGGKHDELREGEFWAVKNISFELKRGECLGLIGHNGAGKSTLLKMLNGLIKPDQGRIEMRGRIGALIELGAGFNPILTGRENIYNKGAVLGFTKKEIDDKFDAIVEFAELEEFIDMPVQNYSSGMKVRLGFAVSAQLDPDILIIDEVLAVGDVGFRIKCMNLMQQLVKNTTVIFVSHVMPQVASICSKCMLLTHGMAKRYTSDLGSVIEDYYNRFGLGEEVYAGNGNAKLTNLALSGSCAARILQKDRLELGSMLNIELALDVDIREENLRVRFGIYNMEYRQILIADTLQDDFRLQNKTGVVSINASIGPLYLNSGKYSLHILVMNEETRSCLLKITNAAQFTVAFTQPTSADWIIPCKWEAL